MNMSEKTLARNVETLCKYLGVRYYHTWNSRNSAPGFPDYVFITSESRVLFRELKTAKGKLTASQQAWLSDLFLAGQDADVWRPEDWPDRIKRELSKGRGISADAAIARIIRGVE